MRTMIIAATTAALALTPLAALAQSPEPQAPQGQPQAQQQPQGQQGAPMVRKVNIVDVADLPAETRPKVDEAAAKASPDDLKGLRSSIDQSPEISKALSDKGAKSSDVILANLDGQGLLTLVTKKRG